jgi:hypothetical protein
MTADVAPSMLEAALAYAQVRDWPVSPAHSIFPAGSVMPGVCTCCLGACDSPGKHPCTDHGFRDATTDPTQIRAWWSRGWRDRNIIGPTGRRSGVDALDIDPSKGGPQSLERLQARYGAVPLTWQVRTGSGGAHYFFAHHLGVRNSESRIAPGVDVRGSGGYVILPPSLHKSGRRYQWIVSPDEAPLAPWPDWLLALLPPPPPPQRPTVPPALCDCAAAEQAVPAGLLQFARAGKDEGTRNSSAFWLACRLVEECGPQSKAAWTAMRIFGAACRPPMDERELHRTWQSAGEETAFQPKTLVVITRNVAQGTTSYRRVAFKRRPAGDLTLRRRSLQQLEVVQ